MQFNPVYVNVVKSTTLPYLKVNLVWLTKYRRKWKKNQVINKYKQNDNNPKPNRDIRVFPFGFEKEAAKKYIIYFSLSTRSPIPVYVHIFIPTLTKKKEKSKNNIFIFLPLFWQMFRPKWKQTTNLKNETSKTDFFSLLFSFTFSSFRNRWQKFYIWFPEPIKLLVAKFKINTYIACDVILGFCAQTFNDRFLWLTENRHFGNSVKQVFHTHTQPKAKRWEFFFFFFHLSRLSCPEYTSLQMTTYSLWFTFCRQRRYDEKWRWKRLDCANRQTRKVKVSKIRWMTPML